MVGPDKIPTIGCTVARNRKPDGAVRVTRQVPCINATLWEVNRGKHLTNIRKDRTCENCRTIIDVLEHRRMVAEDLDFELI